MIAGGLAQTSDLWWRPLHDGVAAESIDLVRGRPVVAAALGADAAIVGAAALAFDRVAAAPAVDHGSPSPAPLVQGGLS